MRTIKISEERWRQLRNAVRSVNRRGRVRGWRKVTEREALDALFETPTGDLIEAKIVLEDTLRRGAKRRAALARRRRRIWP